MHLCRIATVVSGLLLASCGSYQTVPPDLEARLDKSVEFRQIKEAPESYRGRLVMLGGEVLSSKRLKDKTQLEVLQLPLIGTGEPRRDRTASEGRFLAFQKEFLDPATLPAGSRVTITGEITGSVVRPLDETDYVYPTLEIRDLKVWPRMPEGYWSRAYPPFWGPYFGPFGWGTWGYPYWW
jgi:outer membrane lipoprotein